MQPKVENRTKLRNATILIGIVVVAGGIVLYKSRWYFWPKRFGVVEPGWLYRGGQIHARLFEALIDDNSIESVLSLTMLRDDVPNESKELAVVRERQLDFHLIPMPGNGVADFDKLEQAADWIATRGRRPTFVHCAAGVQRTGATIAVYRMKHCGWPLSDALAEARRYGRLNPALVDHLKEYARTRTGQQQSSALMPGQRHIHVASPASFYSVGRAEYLCCISRLRGLEILTLFPSTHSHERIKERVLGPPQTITTHSAKA